MKPTPFDISTLSLAALLKVLGDKDCHAGIAGYQDATIVALHTERGARVLVPVLAKVLEPYPPRDGEAAHRLNCDLDAKVAMIWDWMKFAGIRWRVLEFGTTTFLFVADPEVTMDVRNYVGGAVLCMGGHSHGF